jgi:hypothetical protein
MTASAEIPISPTRETQPHPAVIRPAADTLDTKYPAKAHGVVSVHIVRAPTAMIRILIGRRDELRGRLVPRTPRYNPDMTKAPLMQGYICVRGRS